MPVTVDHFVLSNGDTAKYDYDGLNNKPNLDVHLKLLGGTEIEENTDLNSAAYTNPGNYICSTTTKAGTLTNCPTQYAFVMSVRSSTGDFRYGGNYNYIIREIYGIFSTQVWRQKVIAGASGTWEFDAWHRFAPDDEFKTGRIVMNNSSDSHSLVIRQTKNIVTINGFFKTNIQTVKNEYEFGQLYDVSLPPDAVRLSGFASDYAYGSDGDYCYVVIGTNGSISYNSKSIRGNDKIIRVNGCYISSDIYYASST